MSDTELAALSTLVATELFERECENEIRRMDGKALAYDESVEWPARDALEAELERRSVRP